MYMGENVTLLMYDQITQIVYYLLQFQQRTTRNLPPIR